MRIQLSSLRGPKSLHNFIVLEAVVGALVLGGLVYEETWAETDCDLDIRRYCLVQAQPEINVILPNI